MKFKINTTKKMRNFVLILLSSLIVVFSVLAVGITNAWFTSSDNLTIPGTTPEVTISTIINQEVSKEITLSQTNSGNSISGFYPIGFNNTSNIPVYVRARIECNFADGNTINTDYGTPFDYLSFTLATDNGALWYSTLTGTPTDNAKIMNGWIYFKTSVAVNGTGTIISGITVNQNMPSGAVLKVFVEAVQANGTGTATFGTLPANWPVNS